MSYITKSVSITDTEENFIKAFVKEFTALDSKITCPTDISAEYTTPSHRPLVEIDLGDNFKLMVSRGSPAFVEATNYYDFAVYYGDMIVKSYPVYYMNDGTGGEVYNRCWNIHYISNQNTRCIMIENYNVTSAKDASCKIVITNADSKNYIGTGDASTSPLSTMYYTDGATYTTAIRIPYVAQAGTAEVLKGKAIISKMANLKVAECTGIYDCSNLQVGTTEKVNGENCFIIDTNTAMPYTV